jgi:2-dehydro-3-deoxyphosphogluconate aldolase/(4S)-4-hydroxy-2-oxoglutarate aldolase
MNRQEVCARIVETGIIPAIRVYTPEDAIFAAEAVARGGVPIVEATMTVPGAVQVIHELVRNNPDLIVGAGSLRNLESAQRCLDAGATFLTTPGLEVDIIEFALKNQVAVLPGALTPSEILAAAKAGADFIKIFPCGQVGGPGYIKALKAPFPEIQFIASGGVNQLTAVDYIRAGAAALGIGGDLIHQDAIHRREGSWIVELARRYLLMVRQARSLGMSHETHNVEI